MKGWRTPRGVLVEWASEPPLRAQPAAWFLLIDGGAIVQEFSRTQTALDDWLYTVAHQVVDARLLSSCLGECADRPDTFSSSVVLEGLTQVEPSGLPSRAEVEVMLAARDRARDDAAARQRRDDELRALQLRQALPDVEGSGPLQLVFSLDGGDWVVRLDGREVWRTSSWPWLGKELHRQLAQVVRARYAPRLASLEVDRDTYFSMSFSND